MVGPPLNHDPVTMTISDKSAVRIRLRAVRRMVGGGAIRVSSAYLDRLRGAPCVASYIPVGGEADPGPLEHAASAAGCPIALPHVTDRETPLRFLEWRRGTALVTGPFGLLQPPESAPEALPAVILTPLVGFDRNGARLGQGAGHYDRAFAAHPDAWRIGIAFACQEVDSLPTDPWDIPLQAIATDIDWIEP